MMDSNAIPLSENTKVIVKSSGDLYLRGEGQGEVRFKSSEDRIRVNQSNDTLYIETHASMGLQVPLEATVIVEKVGGSALIQDLNGPLTIQKVGGDLGLQRMGTVRVEKVGGSALIDGVTGGLVVGKIGGDLTVRQAVGQIQIGSVGGTADLQISGSDEIETRAGGDLRLYITEGVAANLSLRAGSSADLYIPSNTNGHFVLQSGGEHIELQFSRQEQMHDQEFESRRYEFTLGSGGAQSEVNAGSDVTVSDEAVEPESISAELERREEAWREAGDRIGGTSWSGGFGFDRTSAWADMVSRRAQEAAHRAEQRTQRAVRRTEDQIRQAAERQIRQAGSHEFHGMPRPPVPPTPPQPAAPRVTEQERLMVLQMLKENKLTVEQAEKLLAALEGRFNQ